MKHLLASIMACFCLCLHTFAQQPADSLLPAAVITAYGQGASSKLVPAAVGRLSARDFQHSGEATPVLAFQKLPGVRLEERSPGSYRVSIRGSSLRSPFGVRNVKVYWENLPLTEANGNTSLNLLDVSLYQQVEVIRGPAASYYGAGTGGVISIGSLPSGHDEGGNPEAEVAYGSFGYLRARAGYQKADSLKRLRLGITHLQTEGYREHSSLARQNAFWSSSFKVSDKRELQASVLMASINYDIPGGLTEEQFQENPRQARSGNAFVKGSVEQNSSIKQRYALVGIGQHYRLTETIVNSTWLFGHASFLNHPFITDYKRDLATGVGARSIWKFNPDWGNAALGLQFGSELLYGFEVARNYGNRAGVADTLNFEDEISSHTMLYFLQADYEIARRWNFTAGLSFNAYAYDINRLVDATLRRPYQLNKKFDPVWAPRVALSYQIVPKLQAWAQVSKGFSPPSLEEIRTNEGSLNEELEAETGTNYELGIRSTASPKLQWDIAAYYFSLQQTITSYIGENSPVTRFRNSGSARQKGLEASAQSRLVQQPGWLLSASAAVALQHYRFRQYQQQEEDYSGNALPGVAPFTSSMGLEALIQPGIGIAVGHSYTSRIPLNDANTAYASGFHLLQARLSYSPQWWQRLDLQFFVSGQNLLNEGYSLGYDLNAFGDRFYQPAPVRSFQLGIVLLP